jgi:hypothetical protein
MGDPARSAGSPPAFLEDQDVSGSRGLELYFLHTVMYRPSMVRSTPLESGAVVRLMPYAFPRSPAEETTAESGVQEMWKPGIERVAAIISRIAVVPRRIGCPGKTTRASGVQ